MHKKNNFKKGSVEMLILNFLSERDLYGYEIAQLVLERGDGYINIPEGSLYPTLYKLENKKLISSYEKQVGKRLKRIYYHINSDGKKYLEELITEYYAVNNCIKKIIEYVPNKKHNEEQ